MAAAEVCLVEELCQKIICAVDSNRIVLCCRPCPRSKDLPEGDGKKAVQTYCVQCHELSQVTRAGYSQEGWQNNIHMMLNVGATLPQDEIELVTQYLAKHFPERPKPDAVVIPGASRYPSKNGSYPRPARDRMIRSRPPTVPFGTRGNSPTCSDGWIHKQARSRNIASRRHMPVRTAGADKDGNIWYTSNFKGHIGKLNPKTGQVTEYPMPDPAARDPHTPSSINRARSGSQCKEGTWSGGSTRRRAR